jgi:hypothetical protein
MEKELAAQVILAMNLTFAPFLPWPPLHLERGLIFPLTWCQYRSRWSLRNALQIYGQLASHGAGSIVEIFIPSRIMALARELGCGV